jgi:HD-GYP domain-containing protein (c-di-GMP phosphodiesterase class II)
MEEKILREQVEEMIKAMAAAFQTCAMYGTGHKIAMESIKKMHSLLEELFREQEEITIGIIGDEIAFSRKPFYETSRKIKGFIEKIREIGLKKISFAKGLREEELKEFNELLLVNPEVIKEKEDLRTVFENTNIDNIALGEIGYRRGRGSGGEGSGGEGSGGGPEADYDESMEYLSQAYENIKGNQPLDADSARRIVSNMISDVVKNKDLLLLLASTKSHDEKMLLHGVNVAVFTLVQAEALGLGKKHMQQIGMAALLHDTARLSVPREEEEKEPEELSEVEKKRRALRNINSAKMLLDMPDVGVLPALAAFEHDVGYDGSGFPERRYGGTPNLISMIITISEHYDRMRAKEEDNKKQAPEKIHEKMMEQSGKKFHPDLLNNFFALVGVYPPGTLVKLNTGEVALVIQASMMDIKRPQVEVLYDKEGKKYEEPQIINLLEKDDKGGYKWSIEKSITPDEHYELPDKYGQE